MKKNFSDKKNNSMRETSASEYMTNSSNSSLNFPDTPKEV